MIEEDIEQYEEEDYEDPSCSVVWAKYCLE